MKSGGTEYKRRGLVFSALFLLVFLSIVALFERYPDTENISVGQLMGRMRTTGEGIGWSHVPALLAMGIGAGFLGGMLGMGGGVLKIAGMLLILKIDIFFARAVSLATLFFTTVSASWPYIQRRWTDWSIIRPMIIPALIGTGGGVLLGNQLRGATLTHVFGFFILFLGLYTLAQVFADPTEHRLKEDFKTPMRAHRHRNSSRGIGVLHGFLCGLLGISGGVIAMPMQQLLLNVPTRNAIANTVAVSALCTGLGSAIVIACGVSSGAFELTNILFVVLFIGVGAFAGAQLGARLGEKIHSGILRLVFVAIVFVAGLSILL
ncbi:MAG: sulfite exporter TauE/SafE family protein [Deltaproteobacteria bacterium]|nr:sulfite exporter TauE/SafE family protein [Deltaproteobacteria bacterium]